MKFEVAVLLGLASAHPLVEKAKEICPFTEWMVNHHMVHPPMKCPAKDPTQMFDHYTFGRKMMYTILNSAIKGFYDDKRANPLDEKCMGDWMVEDHAYIKNVYHKLFHDGDIFGVSHQELKNTSDKAWDMMFNNIEYCGVYRMVDNYYNYCMTNWQDCMYHTKMADRIYDHILELISIGMEEFRMIHKHKDCATDVELLADVAEVVEKGAEFKRIMHGFEGTWDQSTKVEDHLSFKQMWHNYHDFKTEHMHDFKHECPMKKLWKKFMGDVTPEDVFGDIFALLPHMPKLP